MSKGSDHLQSQQVRLDCHGKLPQSFFLVIAALPIRCLQSSKLKRAVGNTADQVIAPVWKIYPATSHAEQYITNSRYCGNLLGIRSPYSPGLPHPTANSQAYTVELIQKGLPLFVTESIPFTAQKSSFVRAKKCAHFGYGNACISVLECARKLCAAHLLPRITFRRKRRSTWAVQDADPGT